MTSTSLVWLRNDLRLADNPALHAACQSDKVFALYIHETGEGAREPGDAARWWLHQSLTALGADMAERGITLLVRAGNPAVVVPSVVGAVKADAIYWNRRYAPNERAVDASIKAGLKANGIPAQSFAGNLLVEPWDIATGQGKPYSVFTPFWKTLREKHITRPLPSPEPHQAVAIEPIDEGYSEPNWAAKLKSHWRIGEKAAQDAVSAFLDERLDGYADGRDFPAREQTSLLSPHLRFGEISARQVWHAAQAIAHADHQRQGAVDKFLSELAWRDFSYHQLYHRTDIANVPMQSKYAEMAWRDAPDDLAAWQSGRTGIPIVDAGMRELWETGYMQNRVRMLVASLLTKNLLVDWRQGEQWFWDCLVDADVANNPASWQWVAGCGLDAAPYFRIFNPVTQGERFDADGAYLRRWVPELMGLPDKWIHAPSSAPESALAEAGVSLGTSYPYPIVDLRSSRARALEEASRL